MTKKMRGYPAPAEPMLAPNKCVGMDIPHDTVRYPKLCSIKYNGIRALSMDGVWRSRNMKPSQMCQEIVYEFKEILDYAYDNMLVLDGEFHSPTYPTVGETRSIMAGKIPLPDDFAFYCFYALPYSVWNECADLPMKENLPDTLPRMTRFKPVKQTLLNCMGEFTSLLEKSKNMNYEGFVLLDPNGLYKHGRGTINQQLILKYKFYDSVEDAKIINLIPRQERKRGVATTTMPSGKAQAVHKQEHFVDTNIAGTMLCHLDGDPNQVIHVPFPVGWDMGHRKRAYAHLGTGSEYDLQGEWVSFQRLACENRDKPIAIKGVEFRDAKD